MVDSDPDDFTSVCLRRGTKDRLEDLKPSDSMSYDEFLGDLADVYEKNAVFKRG